MDRNPRNVEVHRRGPYCFGQRGIQGVERGGARGLQGFSAQVPISNLTALRWSP